MIRNSPDHTAHTGTPAARRRRGRASRLTWAMLIAVTLVLAGTGAAGATVYHRQQDTLATARAERSSAAAALDAALAKARGDGVDASRLTALVDGQKAVLAEPARGARLGLFDGGEIDHLRAEANRLRGLLGQLPGIEGRATTDERSAAIATITDFEAAVAGAKAAGLDESADESSAAIARQAVATAATPVAVRAAVAPFVTKAGDIRAATEQKKASDAAAAAAQAKATLDAARNSAVSALNRADTLLSQAQGHAQLQLGNAPQQIAAAHAALASAVTVDEFTAVAGAARGPANVLSTLLTARSNAYSAMALGRATVADAIHANVDASGLAAQLDGLQPRLDAAGTADDFNAISAGISAATAPIRDRIGIAEIGLGKVIVISLANQSLTAYQDGAVVLTTPVTTGRPVLPTPPGTYSVLRKNSPWRMVTDWAPGTPGWYPPSWVNDVLWFRNDGYGIHDAPWRSRYGPGTQQNGSHGCVNVPGGTMATLYGWAEIGTKVIVH